MPSWTLDRAKLRPLLGTLWAKARTPSAIYLIAGSLSRVGAFFLIPIYTRRLTPAEYGTYALFISVFSLLPAIFTLGLNAALTKAYFDADDDASSERAFAAVARGLLLVTAILSGLGILIGINLPPAWIDPFTHRHIVFMCLGALGASALNTVECWFRTREKAVRAALFPLATFFLTAVGGIFFVVTLHRGVDGAIEAPAVAAIIVGTFSVIFTLWRLHGPGVLRTTVKMVAFSLPFVAHYLAYWVQSAGDRWVISLFTGDNSFVGRYYLAVQLMSPISMVIQAWSQGIGPPMGRTYRDEGLAALKKQLPRYQRHALLISAVTAIGILVFLPILSIVIGPRFLSALKIMPWLGLILVMDSIYFPNQGVVYYAGRSRWIPIIASTTTFGGLGVSALLVPHFAVSGLVAGRFIGSFIAMVAFSVAAYRVTDSRTEEDRLKMK